MGIHDCEHDYLDCFNCTTCGETETLYKNCLCKWNPDKNNQKCESVTSKRTIDYIYQAFSQCTDTSSSDIQNIYCGTKSFVVKDEFSFSMPLVDDLYGTQSIYCEYIFTVSGDEDDYYNINYQFNSRFSDERDTVNIHIVVKYTDYTIASGNLGANFEKNFYNVKEIELRLYFEHGFSSLPFSFVITRKTDNSKLALYITIGVIILACIFCALAIYCLSKKISENARLRQRALFEIAMAHQHGEGVDDETYEQQKLETENKLKIKFALKHSLKSKKYLKKYGVKDNTTCTICIEDFKENKSKVSITPCKHVFHYQCLSNWLHKNVMNPKCPNCNHNLIQDVKDSDIAKENNVVSPERINVNSIRVRTTGEDDIVTNNRMNEEIVIENLESTRNRNTNQTNVHQNTDERNLRTSSIHVSERGDNNEN